MTNSLRKSLQKRNVQPEELLVCLVNGFSHADEILKKKTKTTCLFSEVIEECKKCKSLTDFWLIISPYFAFYSYELLKEIANSEYTLEEDKQKFKEYEEQL